MEKALGTSMNNIVLSCEQIVLRDIEHQHLDLLCGQFPESKMMTLVHQEKNVLGPIEQRGIRSSFLSYKFSSSAISDEPKNFLASNVLGLLSATSKLSVSCSTDLLVNVSRGLIHLLPTCKKTQTVTYLLDWSYLESVTQNSIRGRLLAKYFWYRSLKALSQQSKVFVSSKFLRQDLLEKLERAGLPKPKQLEVLHPYTDIDEFPLKENNDLKRNHVVINAKGAMFLEIEQMINFCQQEQLLWTLIGVSNEQELKLSKKYPDAKIQSSICSGELAPLLSSGLAAIDLSGDAFPDFSLKAMAAGRPLMAKINKANQEFFPIGDSECAPYLFNLNQLSSVSELLHEWSEKNIAPQVRLHRFAQGFREVYFKQKCLKLLTTRENHGPRKQLM